MPRRPGTGEGRECVPLPRRRMRHGLHGEVSTERGGYEGFAFCDVRNVEGLSQRERTKVGRVGGGCNDIRHTRSTETKFVGQ